MPKAAILQDSFVGGEASPLMYARTSSPRYKQSLETELNYISTLQGPTVRRPGTTYLTNVKDSNNPPILVPFEISASLSYIMEFGDKYIRFYSKGGSVVTTTTTYVFAGGTFAAAIGSFFSSRTTNTYQADETGGTITTIAGGSILEISSPYAVADLPLLKWTQSGSTLYLYHPKYPPYKLSTGGAQLWDLRTIIFRDGPYLPINSYSTVSDSTAVTLNTLAANIVTTGPILVVSTMVSAGGLIKVTTTTNHGYQTGQKVYIEAVTGTVEANNDTFLLSTGQPYYWQITVTSPTDFTLDGSAFVHAFISGGTVQPALFWQNSPSSKPDLGRPIALIIDAARYFGLIYTFYTTAKVGVYPTINPTTANFPQPKTATVWYLGVYSVGSYPSCGCFHQNRMILAGSPNQPQEVDGSVVGDFENFRPSDSTTLDVSDNDGFSFQLASRDVNKIMWLSSAAQGLLAGSFSSEWVMQPSSSSAALTPTNFNAAQTSYFGSADVEAVQSGNAALYIQKFGRKIREMNFFFQVGTFRSTDMTEISEHITLPSVTRLCSQRETLPLVWGIRSDGNLVSMIYNRDDASIQAGWSRHQLGGKSDAGGTNPIVLSFGVIPSPDLSFDQMWLIVQRYLNGSKVVTIEYLNKIFDDSVEQKDAVFGDCAGTFSSPKTITAVTNDSQAQVTSAAHGYSNGDKVRIYSVVGLNKNGSNLFTNTSFVISDVATNTFKLKDYSGNYIDASTYSAYVSGGVVRKMVTTVSGLTWLKNETVSVLADGGIHPDVVVDNSGAITLQFPAAIVTVGFSYNSDAKLLRLDAGAADGSAAGQKRRPFKAAMILHRTGDLNIGVSFSDLNPVELFTADQDTANNPPPLFSGVLREDLSSEFSFDSQVCFRQNSMLPGTINSITTFVEEVDI